MGIGRLVLWRHGQTTYNVEGRYQGQVDTTLTEAGLQQARSAAGRLAALLTSAPEPSGPGDVPVPPDGRIAIVSSDLSRAADTAGELAALLGIPVTSDARLRETGYGRWEGLSRAEVAERYPEELARWKSGNDTAVHGGETRAESATRVVEGIRSLVAEATDEMSTVVVVAHGGVLRGAAEELLGLGGDLTGTLGVLGNASWGLLDRRGSRWVLSGWNRR